MNGTLVPIAGPSGAGKDTLIRLAQQRLRGEPRFVFVRRVITRPRDAGAEDHEPASVAEFARRQEEGTFALSWEAHGLCYGVPRTIDRDLAEGRIVIVNVSRAIIPEAVHRYPNSRVVIITAPVEMLAARLAERGREPMSQHQARLGHVPDLPADARTAAPLHQATTARHAGRRRGAAPRACAEICLAKGVSLLSAEPPPARRRR